MEYTWILFSFLASKFHRDRVKCIHRDEILLIYVPFKNSLDITTGVLNTSACRWIFYCLNTNNVSPLNIVNEPSNECFFLCLLAVSMSFCFISPWNWHFQKFVFRICVFCHFVRKLMQSKMHSQMVIFTGNKHLDFPASVRSLIRHLLPNSHQVHSCSKHGFFLSFYRLTYVRVPHTTCNIYSASFRSLFI